MGRGCAAAVSLPYGRLCGRLSGDRSRIKARRVWFSTGKGKSVERICALSEDLEFCCLVSGYTNRCTTCPLPDGFEFAPYRRKSEEVLDAMQVLELEDTSLLTIKSLKAAFRKQALRYHPDHNPGCAQAEDRFKAVFSSTPIFGHIADQEGGSR